MTKQIEHYSPEAAEIDIAADLSELFSDLSREFDKQHKTPESRVSNYSFRGECNFYLYPPIVREYMDLYDLSVDKVGVTVGKAVDHLPSVAIQVFLDSGDMLELSTHRGQAVEEPFELTFFGESSRIPSKKYTVAPQEVGQLLISMALPPSDSSEIERAKADRQPITSLNPRDTQILQLIENSLENQASFYENTQKFKTSYQTSVDNTVTDFSLISTQNSEGDSLYVASAQSSLTDKDAMCSYDISVVCNSLRSLNEINEIIPQGTQTHTSIDGARSVLLSDGTVTSYMSAVVKAIIQES